jgi:hypothetical protein
MYGNIWHPAATSHVVMEVVAFVLGLQRNKEHYHGTIRGLCFSKKETKMT